MAGIKKKKNKPRDTSEVAQIENGEVRFFDEFLKLQLLPWTQWLVLDSQHWPNGNKRTRVQGHHSLCSKFEAPLDQEF